MTIIIPTWIVVTILCLSVIRAIVFLRREATVIKGIRAAWPTIKQFFGPDKEITIEIIKKTENK